ncbi:hypothetical protein CXG81DRAFT_26177 [Caulochytrium protostelioides]|uniref:Dynein light intermediate chain n=1 Tax=Caulochytrium protostelioides TaxID=1555241 RepID=A0A4P9X7B0_9FUNG|nr:hypothetical protein CXG81DRAFT_26177 [Caulochytrium protostelioides]|eukprot:RKP01116.1 hypothetical protein CXG81DRAFT_26177 [Caulochytrium protostelioides]
MLAQSSAAPLAAAKDTPLWSSILAQVAASRALPVRRVVILGDEQSGKSAIAHALMHTEGVARAASGAHGVGAATASARDPPTLAMAYDVCDVQDDDGEPAVRLGLYQLAGHHIPRALLARALAPPQLETMVALLVLDVSKPYTMVSSLLKWLQFLEKELDDVVAGDPAAGALRREQNEIALRSLATRWLQSGMEHEAAASPSMTPDLADYSQMLPLDAHMLTVNLGIPLAIVCHKADVIDTTQRGYHLSDEHLDLIQQAVRTVALQYGAACFYTSTHARASLQRVQHYVWSVLMPQTRVPAASHRDAPVPHVVNRSAIVIPPAWDSIAKIKLLNESFDPDRFLDNPLEYVGTRLPENRYPPHRVTPAERRPEPEHRFLAKLHDLLAADAPLHAPSGAASMATSRIGTPNSGGSPALARSRLSQGPSPTASPPSQRAASLAPATSTAAAASTASAASARGVEAPLQTPPARLAAATASSMALNEMSARLVELGRGSRPTGETSDASLFPASTGTALNAPASLAGAAAATSASSARFSPSVMALPSVLAKKQAADGKPTTPENQTEVLASFFKSLLTKKTPSATGATMPLAPSSVMPVS